jgi:hypothetical protein
VLDWVKTVRTSDGDVLKKSPSTEHPHVTDVRISEMGATLTTNLCMFADFKKKFATFLQVSLYFCGRQEIARWRQSKILDTPSYYILNITQGKSDYTTVCVSYPLK